MFIAHLPAGYLLSRFSFARAEPLGLRFERFACAGMLGAVAPDFDLAYFYLVDERRHNHHLYWTHFPILWIGMLALSMIWLRSGRKANLAALAAVFALNGLGHMVLDSVVGRIWWLAPFGDQPYSLFAISATHHIWWLNFLLHWSFALELAIVAWAFGVWRWRPMPRPNKAGDLL